MLNQVTVPNVFGPLPGPVPLNFLDANFNAILQAMNDASLGVNYLLDTGAANAVTLSTPVNTTFSYTAGVTLTFKANANNTGATTINVNGLGAKTLLNGTAAMVARSIVVGETYVVTYDGTNFQITGGNSSAAFFDQGVPGVGQPGIRFAARPKTGLGLINTNDFAIYSNGNTVFSVADATQIISQGITQFAGGGTIPITSTNTGATPAFRAQGANSASAGVISLVDGQAGTREWTLNSSVAGAGSFSIRDITAGNSDRLTINSTGLTSISDSAGALFNAGFLGDPLNNQSGVNYTFTANDRGKEVFAGTSGFTLTVPASVFSAGDRVTIISLFAAGTVTIAQGASTTMYWSGHGVTTGNRTMTTVGTAILRCIGTNTFVLSGDNLT